MSKNCLRKKMKRRIKRVNINKKERRNSKSKKKKEEKKKEHNKSLK